MTIQSFDTCVVLTGKDAERVLEHVRDDSPNPLAQASLERGRELLAATQEGNGDLLLGAAAIAKFLGINRRQAYTLIYGKHIPSFKAGGTVSARKSSLTKWMADAEASMTPKVDMTPRDAFLAKIDRRKREEKAARQMPRSDDD